MKEHEPECCSREVTAGPGGAMTDEVGVVTGDLTLKVMRRPDGLTDVRVQYTGAEEWYTLTGGPVRVPPGGLEGLCEATAAAVRAGGAAEVPR
ncbi:hypothetical protein BLA24_05645 [Streptomyces cinnamoneus]|uniref:Uncharacterized protein n=1 Tax=Streptomyces cinnamoneus TaxID=53446 RepID=A0A2G1XNG1_STRCJ|nr:hypothetical protein [Streptomyces cinnamoneus]PHQ52750.1 hypothetical protein BLA24_05645 [Streptomyces cinnamoneus]PPT11848.1 hypothetical protein CYQ11_02105 [Streptomyces cinnamoneus]